MKATFIIATAAFLVFSCIGGPAFGVPGILIGGSVIYLIVFALSATVHRRPDWPNLALTLICAFTFVSAYVVRPAVLSHSAQTPEQHIRAVRALTESAILPNQHYREIWRHYVAAAEAGHPVGQRAVGMAYLYRHFGIPFDRMRAKQWLGAAAQQEDVGASRELANVDTVPAAQ